MKAIKQKPVELDSKSLKYGSFSALMFAAITLFQILSDLLGLSSGNTVAASTALLSAFVGLIILILLLGGVALLLLSFNALSKSYGEKKIINNLLIGIFGVWVVALIIIVVGGVSIAFSSLQGLNSSALSNQTLVQSRINANLSSGSNGMMTYVILAGIIPPLALIVTMYFLMSSLNIIEQKSKVPKFAIAGKMLLLSAAISFIISAIVLLLLNNSSALIVGELGALIGGVIALYGWMQLYYSFQQLSVQ